MDPTPAQLAKRPRPKNDAEALRCEQYGCDVKFGLMKRRHHCRGCGFIYCDKHCKNLAEIPLLGYYTPVRICQGCLVNGVEDPDDVPPAPTHGKTDGDRKKEKKEKKDKKDKKEKAGKKDKKDKKGKDKKKGKKEGEEDSESEAASSPAASPKAAVGGGPPPIPPPPGSGPPPIPPQPGADAAAAAPAAAPQSADIAGLVDRIAHLERLLEAQRNGPTPARPGEEGLSPAFPPIVFSDVDGDRIAIGIAADHTALLYSVNHEPRPPFLVAKYHPEGPAIEFADIDTAVVLPRGGEDGVLRQLLQLIDHAVGECGIDVLHNLTESRVSPSHGAGGGAAVRGPPSQPQPQPRGQLVVAPPAAALPGVDTLRHVVPLPQSSPYHDPMARQRAAEAERWDSDDDFSSSDSDDWGPNKVVMAHRPAKPPPPAAVPAPPSAVLALPAPPPGAAAGGGLHMPPPPMPPPGEAVLAIAPIPAAAPPVVVPAAVSDPSDASRSTHLEPAGDPIVHMESVGRSSSASNLSLNVMPVAGASFGSGPGGKPGAGPNMMALAAAAGKTRLRKAEPKEPRSPVTQEDANASFADLRKNLRKSSLPMDGEVPAGDGGERGEDNTLADLKRNLRRTEEKTPVAAPAEAEAEPAVGQHLLRKVPSDRKPPPAEAEPAPADAPPVVVAVPAPPAPPPVPAPAAETPPAMPAAPSAPEPEPVPAPAAAAPEPPAPASTPAPPAPPAAPPTPPAKPEAPVSKTKGMFDDSSDDEPRRPKPAAKKNIKAMLAKRRGDDSDDDW